MARSPADIREFLNGVADGGWLRARELYDSVVKYLVAVNGGAIVVTLGVAGAFVERAPPSLFMRPMVSFGVGISFAGAGLLLTWFHFRRRADKAYDLRCKLDTGEKDAAWVVGCWNSFAENERKREKLGTWLPAAIAFLAFLIGMAFGFSSLTELSASTEGACAAADASVPTDKMAAP